MGILKDITEYPEPFHPQTLSEMPSKFLYFMVSQMLFWLYVNTEETIGKEFSCHYYAIK